MLHFRINSGDEILDEHLRTCGRNALYTSKTIQEQMIAICGDVVRSSKLQEICSVPMFSIMADEATDVSNKERLALCSRSVNSSTLNITEHFLGYNECITGVTEEAITAQILKNLEDWKLSASQLRGQTYGGTGSMAGKRKGVAARISKQYPKALYTHFHPMF